MPLLQQLKQTYHRRGIISMPTLIPKKKKEPWKAPAADPSACNNHLLFPSCMTLVNYFTLFCFVDTDRHYATHSRKVASTHEWCALGSSINFNNDYARHFITPVAGPILHGEILRPNLQARFCKLYCRLQFTCFCVPSFQDLFVFHLVQKFPPGFFQKGSGAFRPR